jgi:hypothetical protein
LQVFCPEHAPQLIGGHTTPLTVGLKVPQFSPGGHNVGHEFTHWPLLPQVDPPVHVPQTMVPPQPFDTVPQVIAPHACACVWGVQTQTPGPPSAPLHAFGAEQFPQGTEPPQPSGAEPQVLPAHACVFGVQTQVPGLPVQDVCGPVHVPQVIVPTHPSETVPQVLFPQACDAVSGVQRHTPAVPPSVTHVAAVPTQTPQLYVPPQPSEAVPQLFVPHASDSAIRAHASGCWQASLISAYSKNVFALERQSWSAHSRPT